MAENSLFSGLGEHIDELRSRLLKSLVAMAVTVLACFFVARRIIDYLTIPIGGIKNLQSIEVTENITVYMKVALLSGFVLALPFITYQVFAFVLPGLKPAEKKWLFISIPFVTIMFLGGVAFTYFVMLRGAIPFLIGFLGVTTVPRLSNYINFVLNLMFWVGLTFESPLVIMLLAKFGIVNAGMLFRGWRIAVVLSALLAAVITPTTDPVNMALLMTPLMGLYFFSIFLAFLVRPKQPPA